MSSASGIEPPIGSASTRTSRSWRAEAERVASRKQRHATVTSQLLRFVDDVHIELRVAACGTELHVRSQSRIGRGDFGANARHVMELHLTLDRLL